MRPKISIILPIYNVENYINEAIGSIINQTIGLKNLEIIMVDDGSTDDSGKIIDQYEKEYSNFKAFHFNKPSGAAGRPRNMGIHMASGEYIMFLDPDDLYVPNACEILYNAAKEYDSDVVMGTFVLFNSKRKWQYPLFTQKKDKAFPNKLISEIANIRVDQCQELLRAPAVVCAKIFKMDFIKENNISFPEGIVSEDAVFATNALLAAEKLTFIPEVLYEYRQREDGSNPSVTQKPRLKLFDDFSKARKKIIDLYESYGKLKYENVRYQVDFDYIVCKVFETKRLGYKDRVDILDALHWFIVKGKDGGGFPINSIEGRIIKCVANKKYDRAFALIDMKYSKIYRAINKLFRSL